MSQVRLVVRDAFDDWSGFVHGSMADVAIAALSADPETKYELESACGRFEQPDPDYRCLSQLRKGSNDEPHDAGRVLIDLIGRVVFVESTYSLPRRTGAVVFHNGKCATTTQLRYTLADDWEFVDSQMEWARLATDRREERAARPPLDTRAILYGQPLWEFIASAVFTAWQTRSPDAADVIQAIHASWLLTPRADLSGQSPREIAMARRTHIGYDIQNQADNWAALDRCPPGLDKESLAFRYGGFGTHEMVMHYDLVRVLLHSCWSVLEQQHNRGLAAGGPNSVTLCDFLTSEAPRLEEMQNRWLVTPNPEFHGQTPLMIIDRERSRLPEGLSAAEAIVDSECPCCQIMADMPGPVFWSLDGCNMDEDFAFDIDHHTREEWEAEQREYEEFSRKLDAQDQGRIEQDNSAGSGDKPPIDRIWASRFSVAEDITVPRSIRLIEIAGHLGELISDLRGESNSINKHDQHEIDQLNREFGNLREVLQTDHSAAVEALAGPVIDRFTETLAEVSERHPQLVAKCESVASLVKDLLRHDAPQDNGGTSDQGGDDDEPDLPF